MRCILYPQENHASSCQAEEAGGISSEPFGYALK